MGKCGTYARVFSETLTQGNSKNEIRKRDKDGKKRGVSMEKNKMGMNKEVLMAYHIRIKIQ